MTSIHGVSQHDVDLAEAARQLELAVHDSQVAYDCVGLGHLERAQEHAITARAAVDAAELILRSALLPDANVIPPDEVIAPELQAVAVPRSAGQTRQEQG
jgi:hypothetical protein